MFNYDTVNVFFFSSVDQTSDFFLLSHPEVALESPNLLVSDSSTESAYSGYAVVPLLMHKSCLSFQDSFESYAFCKKN